MLDGWQRFDFNIKNISGTSNKAADAISRKGAEEIADCIQELHKEVKKHLEQANAKYKQLVDAHRHAKSFEIGNLVMIHLRKSRLPIGSHNKLTNKKHDIFKVLDKSGENAYKIDLPSYLHMSPTFNVVDLYDYHASNSFSLATITRAWVHFKGKNLMPGVF